MTFGRNFRLRTQLSFRFPVISAKYQVEGAEAIRTSFHKTLIDSLLAKILAEF